MRLEWKTCWKAGVTVGLLYLFIQYWGTIANGFGVAVHAAMPLIVGFVIAYAVNILMCFYQKIFFPKAEGKWIKKVRNVVCILLAYVSLAGIIALIIGLVVPELINCIKLLLVKIPPFMNQLIQEFELQDRLGIYYHNFISSMNWNEFNWQEIAKKATDWLAGNVGGAMGIVGKTISTTFSTTFTVIMSLIFSVYLLAGKEKLLGQVRRIGHAYLKQKVYQRLEYIMVTVNDCFHNFIVGQCLEAVILGSLCAVGMLILRMPYAAMIGALIGFSSLIPVAGAYIGGAVGFFMVATVSPVQALVFLVFLVILQQVEGQLIYPRVVGSSIGLPGLWVLAAVTVGGSVMGVLGMLIFVPLASALYRLVRNDVNERNCEDISAENEIDTVDDTLADMPIEVMESESEDEKENDE